MLILAIDTSGPFCSAALLEDHHVLKSVAEEGGRAVAEHLIPMIEELMKTSHKSLKELDAVATAVGPGSFTGVRIGIATAKALGMALSVPVWGVNNFESLAYQTTKKLAVVLDTHRDDYYVQFFDEKGNPETKPSLMTAEDLKSSLPFSAVGDGALELNQQIGSGFVQVPPTASVIAVGRVAFDRKDRPQMPEPLYLREAYA